ncbi:MAG: HAMP domain-containing histidine kinase [Candidatus Pacebacteria bacterium]|nr:HAMP domain-containing histidine kinase [Candidatus Paceibacterota bacterium]
MDDILYIIQAIPPSTQYALVGIFFAIAMVSSLSLALRLIWKKMGINEVLKYEFITIVAHKFRTPLTHIKWSTDELIKEETDPYKKEAIQDIQKSNEKLIKLTNTLVEITDSENASSTVYIFERTDVCEFARKIGDEIKNEFHEKNVFFSIQCAPEPIFVKMDAQRMEFVLQTILENAKNYTPPGKNVEVTVMREGNKALISVRDGGIGIDKKDIELISTKFYRTTNAKSADTEGFGVGLYLAQSITKRHKGSIQVYSEGIGLGSTFTIVVPLAK